MRKNILGFIFTLLTSNFAFSAIINADNLELHKDIVEKLNFDLPIEVRMNSAVDVVSIQSSFKYEINKSGNKLVVYLGKKEMTDVDLVLPKLDMILIFFKNDLGLREITLEKLFNSEMGSSLAKHDLLLLYKLFLSSRIDPNTSSRIYTFSSAAMSVVEGWLSALEKDLNTLDIAATGELKDRREKWKQYKVQKKLDQLDQLELKLNDYVKRNDRKNAAKLIEAYLPWFLMEPMEKLYWQQWIESIRNPDFSKSMYLYRGLEDKTDPKQILELESGKTNLGFFSPVLTKNQGNYNRRLRSLSTQREKYNKYNSILKYKSFSFAEKFIMHAEDPHASSFLSFSTDYSTALRFSKVQGGFLVARLDPRRLIFNKLGLAYEREALIPLVIFPDEVVKHIDFNKNPDLRIKLSSDKFYKILLEQLPSDQSKKLAETNSINYDDFKKFWDRQVSLLSQSKGLKCENIF